MGVEVEVGGRMKGGGIGEGMGMRCLLCEWEGREGKGREERVCFSCWLEAWSIEYWVIERQTFWDKMDGCVCVCVLSLLIKRYDTLYSEHQVLPPTNLSI